MTPLSSLAHAPAIDCRPMSLALKHALIAMDIEHELVKAKIEYARKLRDAAARRFEARKARHAALKAKHGWVPRPSGPREISLLPPAPPPAVEAGVLPVARVTGDFSGERTNG